MDHSKNSRWESSHHSLRNCSETIALDTANNLCHIQTVSYGCGRVEYTFQEIVDGHLQPPRKPLRRESLEGGFHIIEVCPHGLSEDTSCLDDRNLDRTAPLDHPILCTSSPRTTIRLRAIRPPTKPVRKVSCEPLGSDA